MNKVLLILSFLFSSGIAHPVSYTINLDVSYDINTQKAKVICKSNSKNKCGLYNYNILDENDKIMVTKRYPFLKKHSFVKLEKKPFKLVFFLRKTPEHNYVKLFK